MYIFNTIPIKTPEGYCVDNDKLILKFIWKVEGTRVAITILKKKEKVGEISLPDFKTYCKGTIIKTLWYWWRDRDIDQWIRIYQAMESQNVSC